MKDLYAILQVAETATSSEIKQAYRKLARTYHPDKLTEAGSGERMRELNEAYAILGREEKRRQYDYLRKLAYQVPDVIVTPPPRRQPPPVAFRRRTPERELVKPYLPVMEKLLLVVLLFSGILLTDWLLPAQQSAVAIASIRQQEYKDSQGERSVVLYVVTEQGSYQTSQAIGKLFVGKEKAVLASSYLLHQPKLLYPYPHAPAAVRIRESVYANFAFFPLLMTLLAMLGLRKNQAPESRFSFGIGSLFLALITVLLL